MKIDIKSEIILGNYECEKEVNSELIIENDENDDAPADERFEENHNETYSEKSDTSGSRPSCRSANSQIVDESSKDEDGSLPVKKRYKNICKIKRILPSYM